MTGVEPATFGFEVQRAIHCATGSLYASTGNRTRTSCLEGTNSNHWTIDALSVEPWTCCYLKIDFVEFRFEPSDCAWYTTVLWCNWLSLWTLNPTIRVQIPVGPCNTFFYTTFATMCINCGTHAFSFNFEKMQKCIVHSSTTGFEPARAEPNRFQVYRLNHSATLTKMWLLYASGRIRTHASGENRTWVGRLRPLGHESRWFYNVNDNAWIIQNMHLMLCTDVLKHVYFV